MIEVFYFFLFQVVAIGMAFMPAHLRALGLTGAQISTALAVSPLLALAVPLGWAWLADRTQRHDRVLQLIAFGAFVGFTPLAWAHGRAASSFALILLGYLGYATFFAVAAWVYDMGENHRKQLMVVGGIAAVDAVLALGLGLAGWLS